MSSEEKKRLQSAPADSHVIPWKKWGTYVSERQWASVREDYSPDGNAWEHFTHDMARSRAYRWGEDGIAGICDYFQRLIFSWAFWNGKDSILKERLFGLNPFEGNHGEDVKEYYFYLDATPTHSYMKYLYKYPQAAFPYEDLVLTNKKRGVEEREYELLDTGVFSENRYFDIFVEYAKAEEEDICIKIEIINRGDQAASLHLLPQLFFRNCWSWTNTFEHIPEITLQTSQSHLALFADPEKLPPVKGIPYDYSLDGMYLYGPTEAKALFTNNETHNERLYNAPSRTPYVKDAFHRYVVNREECINPEQKGTKAAYHYEMVIPPLQSQVFYFRFSSKKMEAPLEDVESLIRLRKKEADAFYAEVQAKEMADEDKLIQRQAFAGMLWSKQFYHYNVEKWLTGDSSLTPPPETHKTIRNSHWEHLNAEGILSMPDKWEYPWFAAWDLAFHTIALAYVDKDYAKEQLHSLLSTKCQHPSGQIPAYEWGFSDLNPPVQAWALWRLYLMDEKRDVEFLERCFLKLMNNFSWWVNKIDKLGNNFFEGGFLGLDNISIIDRSKPLPNGGFFEESDGTGWMGFFSLLMMKISLELAAKKSLVFEEIALSYFKHFLDIAKAMQGTKSRGIDMWNEEDGFFYDIVSHPNGAHQQIKIHSFVGIIPLYSLEILNDEEIKKFPKFYENFHYILKEHPKMCERCVLPLSTGSSKRYLLSLMKPSQIQRVLNRVWDPEEFFSPYGLRSLSKYHEKNPFIFHNSTVGYEPGESLERIKGGNSNWRGPIWHPTNFLVLESLDTLDKALGPSLTIKTKEGPLSFKEASTQLKNNLINLYRRDVENKRPVHGDYAHFQKDPAWKDLILFYEHYHGDNGRGLGASHQTGWSGLVAVLIAEI